MVNWERVVCKYTNVSPEHFAAWALMLIIVLQQVLLLPTIFAKLSEKTLYIFGGVNVLSIIIVWALYPETNQRTLEEMNLVFACDSIWNWEAEKNFAILKEENPELVQAARRGTQVVDPETGVLGGEGRKSSYARKGSLVPRRFSDANVHTESNSEDEKSGDVKHV